MKPVGIDPVIIDGITMRKSAEVPEGVQVLYSERTGEVLWLGLIGTNPEPGSVQATAITLSHCDYEIALRSHRNEKIRRRKG